MPIDRELFKRETDILVKRLNDGIYLGKNGQDDRSIEALTDVIISAGRLMQRDPAIGKALGFDRTILVAKGYQLKAYAHKMEVEPEHREQILQEVGRIARGDISYENPYLAEIYDAFREWVETDETGNFYTRPK